MINKSLFYNNTPSNVMRPLIQFDVTGRCFFMDELKNLANVVIGNFREIGIAMMSPVAMLFH